MEHPIDIDKTKEILEPDKTSGGGLQLPGKERLLFRQPERKSLLGLDVLANAKRAGAEAEGLFKVPKEKISSMMASMDDEVEENASSSVTGPDEVDDGSNSNGVRNSTSRRYRGSSGSKTSESESQITEERFSGTSSRHGSKSSSHSEMIWRNSSIKRPPTPDEEDDREASVEEIINKKLIESGEKERLKELLRERLNECGWKDEIKSLCRSFTRKKGRNNVTVDDLVHLITPKGRAAVPDSVKAELLHRIRSFLHSTTL